MSCNFEATDNEIPIEFTLGGTTVKAFWLAVPRIGETVNVKSRMKDEALTIRGRVTAVEWSDVDKYSGADVFVELEPLEQAGVPPAPHGETKDLGSADHP